MNRHSDRIYLRRVARHLICPRKQRKLLLEQARQEVSAFCAQEERTDLHSLTHKFGQPSVFADALMTDFSYLQRLRFARRKTRQLTAAVLALALVCGAALVETVHIYRCNSGYQVVTVVEVEEQTGPGTASYSE